MTSYMNKSFLGVLAAITILFWTEGRCTEIYHLTGRITKLGSDSVQVKRGDDEFEFSRDQLKEDPLKRFRKGDSVTISYTLHAKEISTPQEAGEARPGEKAPGSFENEKIILDDRIYYNAKNQARSGNLPKS